MTKSIGMAVIAALPSVRSGRGSRAERIREHTKFLASDLLEGRGVGQRGGDLATEYIATQLALAGAKPAGDNGTYFQKVPLVGVETQPAAQLSARGRRQRASTSSGATISSASSRDAAARHAFEADAVFVGHGIAAPEFKWDDFKGVDVKGKILVLFTNEPPSTDPKFFDGRALTYYGRWTYKYEEALRRGARGAHHHSHDADGELRLGRGARIPGGARSPFVKLAPGEKALAFAGLGDAGGRRQAARRWRARRSTSCWRRRTSRDFKPIASRHPDPRPHAVEDPARWRRAMSRRSFRAAIRS